MKARLIEWRVIAPEVRHFVFEAAEEIRFTPGQFVSMKAELEGREVTRAYSVAAPPAGRRIELCLNRVIEGKFSPFL
ncbi:MAG: FAD-binding oxidoreductase, partial [Bryobacteraceae bacterium]